MDFLHPAENFEVASIEIRARANCSEDALAFASGPMDGESHLNQVFNHHLDLVFTCGFLHCDDHKLAVSLKPPAIS